VYNGRIWIILDNTCNLILLVTHSAETPLRYTGTTASLLEVTQPVVSGSTTIVNIDPVSSVLLAQQLPALPKFSGDVNDRDLGVNTFEEWLERFELMSTTLSWSSQAKLVNVITRLHGQAYSFFRSCHMEQRTSNCLLVAELCKRFTSARLPAV